MNFEEKLNVNCGTYTSRFGGEYKVSSEGGGYLRVWCDRDKEYKQVFGASGGSVSATPETIRNVVIRHEKRIDSLVSHADIEELLELGLIDFDITDNNQSLIKKSRKAKLKMLGY